MRAWALACVAGTAACAATTRDVAHAPAAAPPGEVTSNVLRADYAGSQACAKCHAHESEGWARSPMHRMTRALPGAEVAAPFDGTVFRFKDDQAVLTTRGQERFMELTTREAGKRTYRLTRVIGGNHREDFAGVDTERGGDEEIMPVSWLRWSKRLRYKGYSVMSHERPGLRAGPVWSATCIFCHNTEPYALDLLGALAAPLAGGKRVPGYQGAWVDPLLPEARRWRYVVTDPGALERALAGEMTAIGAAPASGGSALDVLTQTMSATRTAFDAKDLVEVGIGCESCHGGAAAHARDPRTMPSLLPRAPFMAIEGLPKDPAKARAAAIDRTCARCHQVLFSRYPWTWEGGDRARNPGGSHINSGEARDFLLGGCASALACTACHDPHASKGVAEVAARLETRAGDATCTACHAKYATDDALRAHAHHAPDGAGARCVACHMPKKNMSLDSGLGATTGSARRPRTRRSSRIGRSSARSATRARAPASSSRPWRRGGASAGIARLSRTSTAASTGP